MKKDWVVVNVERRVKEKLEYRKKMTGVPISKQIELWIAREMR